MADQIAKQALKSLDPLTAARRNKFKQLSPMEREEVLKVALNLKAAKAGKPMPFPKIRGADGQVGCRV